LKAGLAEQVSVCLSLTGSLTDLTCSLKKQATVEAINSAFKQVAEGAMRNILEYTEDPIVSADIIGQYT